MNYSRLDLDLLFKYYEDQVEQDAIFGKGFKRRNDIIKVFAIFMLVICVLLGFGILYITYIDPENIYYKTFKDHEYLMWASYLSCILIMVCLYYRIQRKTRDFIIAERLFNYRNIEQDYRSGGWNFPRDIWRTLLDSKGYLENVRREIRIRKLNSYIRLKKYDIKKIYDDLYSFRNLGEKKNTGKILSLASILMRLVVPSTILLAFTQKIVYYFKNNIMTGINQILFYISVIFIIFIIVYALYFNKKNYRKGILYLIEEIAGTEELL